MVLTDTDQVTQMGIHRHRTIGLLISPKVTVLIIGLLIIGLLVGGLLIIDLRLIRHCLLTDIRCRTGRHLGCCLRCNRQSAAALAAEGSTREIPGTALGALGVAQRQAFGSQAS